MKVLVSGVNGLIGAALAERLRAGSHTVIGLTRCAPPGAADCIVWNPAHGDVDPSVLEGFDAVVHLAGENLGAGRWSARKKEAILVSRVAGTHFLCERLERLRSPPRVLVCASAVGYFGDRGDEELTEASAPGTGYLADVCRAWEGAASPALRRGIRVAHLRFGMVLSGRGGALARMRPLFRLGLGGRLGDGRQYWSWIAIEDAVGAVLYAIAREDLHGPVNAVSPSPVTNAVFTRALARALHRPALFPVPGGMLRLATGAMARELLLASCRAVPARLLATGYEFRWPDVAGALAHVLS